MFLLCEALERIGVSVTPKGILNDSLQAARHRLFKKPIEHFVGDEYPMRFAGLDGDRAPVVDAIKRQTAVAPPIIPRYHPETHEMLEPIRNRRSSIGIKKRNIGDMDSLSRNVLNRYANSSLRFGFGGF